MVLEGEAGPLHLGEGVGAQVVPALGPQRVQDVLERGGEIGGTLKPLCLVAFFRGGDKLRTRCGALRPSFVGTGLAGRARPGKGADAAVVIAVGDPVVIAVVYRRRGV